MNKSHFFTFPLLLILSLPVSANVVDTADVSIGGNTYRTFQDDTTSLLWLDLDNFWDDTTSYNSLTSSLVGSGFRLASLSDLADLQLSIPAIPANFAAEVTIVGGNNVSRNLIWGIYEDGDSSDGVSYSWKDDSDVVWNFTFNAVSESAFFFSSNSTDRDLGAWVVAENVDIVPAAVPVPTLSFWGLAILMGLVLIFAANARRKFNKTAY